MKTFCIALIFLWLGVVIDALCRYWFVERKKNFENEELYYICGVLINKLTPSQKDELNKEGLIEIDILEKEN